MNLVFFDDVNFDTQEWMYTLECTVEFSAKKIHAKNVNINLMSSYMKLICHISTLFTISI